jgi:hypothetical protein
MRTFKVSDQLYEQLKNFVVDPFDDTPDVVIGRLIEIVNKAKDRWSSFDVCDRSPGAKLSAPPHPEHQESPPQQEDEPVVVL